jgi:hypothetical protein
VLSGKNDGGNEMTTYQTKEPETPEQEAALEAIHATALRRMVDVLDVLDSGRKPEPGTVRRMLEMLLEDDRRMLAEAGLLEVVAD